MVSAAALCAALTSACTSILSDHMVLQQRPRGSYLWGWASYEGETVIVETSWGVKVETKADARGEWRVKVKTPAAQPLSRGIRREWITFTVPGENRLQIKDVLIGEVWVCSGQSNMSMMMGPDFPEGHNGWYGEKFWKEESAKTDRPALRVFNVEKTARAEPQDDCKGVLPDHITLPRNADGLTADLKTGWQACGLETAPYVSAVAYYFAAMLQEKLDAPVGIITSDVGGSPIQTWISLDALRKLPAYETTVTKLDHNGPTTFFLTE